MSYTTVVDLGNGASVRLCFSKKPGEKELAETVKELSDFRQQLVDKAKAKAALHAKAAASEGRGTQNV